MRILVVYASKYGATAGIAGRIASVLNESGHQAAAVPVSSAGLLDGYDAYVIGSAVYMFSWLKEATAFVQRNAAMLSTKPVWLFGSGPLGTETTDAEGRDKRESAAPKEFEALQTTIQPRGMRVFYGAFDHTQLGLRDRLIYAMPAARKILPDGDFRDWDEVEAWARSIAASLVPTEVG